ncbi:hypothetical protein RF11_15138 [Thelohanellus kitauei]|uniref:Uncharacterized protein n=1 Tax=Thelohanellus kitauei TaxID=669202 RepID=A0A0C2IGC8_THEKT|nr:hypothetical protein RF11_15138 [Thelohanellus kitauei]
MECTGCKLNIFDFGVITETKESLFNFLFEHRVLSRTISCNQCRETIEADIDHENFRCRRYGADVIQKRRRKLLVSDLGDAGPLAFFKAHNHPLNGEHFCGHFMEAFERFFPCPDHAAIEMPHGNIPSTLLIFPQPD